VAGDGSRFRQDRGHGQLRYEILGLRAVRPAGSLLLLIAGGATAALPVFAQTRPAEVAADPPSALSVTVYRAPYRPSGSIDLDQLQGFALVSETRAIHLPAGESRLRFEGVADGIEPASAIVTGLEGGVLEKNRDAALLSPAALVAATLGRPVELVRTNPKTGKIERRDATILAGGDSGDGSGAGGADGVVMQTADGIEGLRCSGLPETFSFESAAGLQSRATLSVRVRTTAPVSGQVTLSYLARGFDWAADYTATLAPDGHHMDLGAWVTLANGNGVGFPQAHTQVVAGHVNREQETVEPIDLGGPIVATCWPRGTTSDQPEVLQLKKAAPFGMATTQTIVAMAAPIGGMAGDLMEIVTTPMVKQEQLGDLKLYRVPEATTVASRQSKQVRLLDRGAIPVATVYGAEVSTSNPVGPQPASWLLRTKNTDANHLGLPLPSGRVAVFLQQGGERLLAHESDVHDLAIDEEVEIGMGDAPDVQVTATQDGDSYRDADRYRVDIANARPEAIQFELTLNFNDDSVHVRKADRPSGTKNGRPIFRLRVAANSTATIRYQTIGNGARGGARRSPKQ
jgi:hypothetical protein